MPIDTSVDQTNTSSTSHEPKVTGPIPPPPSSSPSHTLAALTNLSTAILLAAIVSSAIYVSLTRLIVSSGPSTPGYRVTNLPATSWNVGCTVIGTLLGLLASVSFALQDDVLTRKELASEKGVVALFMRPLTLRRGWWQLWRRQYPPERTLLVLATLATALSSASTVALFGIRGIEDVIVNTHPSFPLFALNMTWIDNYKDGGNVLGKNPASESYAAPLNGFLYKAAYIAGLKARDRYHPKEPYVSYIPEAGTLGDTMYPDLWTRGVGLNMSSYLQFSGPGHEFNMPGRFEFLNIRARLFGTRISVKCENVSEIYTTSSDSAREFGDVRLSNVASPGRANITMFRNLDRGFGYERSLTIGSQVRLGEDEHPIHTVIFPAFASQDSLVLECRYTGYEYVPAVSLASPVSPLYYHEEDEGVQVLIGPHVKQKIANMTNVMMLNGGGTLTSGFYDAGYNDDGYNNTGVIPVIETIFGQVGEAYISLMRQSIEKSNLYIGLTDDSDFVDIGAKLELRVRLQRLGGAQMGWIAVPGLLLLVTLFGTIRTCQGGRAVAFDAQDNVDLLKHTMLAGQIRDRCRVRYDQELVVLELEVASGPVD